MSVAVTLWIQELLSGKQSDLPQPLLSRIQTAINALAGLDAASVNATANQVVYVNGAGAVVGSNNFTFNDTTNALNLNGVVSANAFSLSAAPTAVIEGFSSNAANGLDTYTGAVVRSTMSNTGQVTFNPLNVATPVFVGDVNAVLALVGNGATPRNLMMKNVGAFNTLQTLRYNGTYAVPNGLALNDTFGALTGNGYGLTAIALGIQISYVASEAWTDTAHGSRIEFNVVQNGTVASTPVFTMRDDGGFQQLRYLTVATLPAAAAANKGTRTFVTDALAPAFGVLVAAGGAIFTPVYSDGVIWRCG